jgi:tryptophan synthase alpha chain
MAHVVLGYPSIEETFELVRTIVEAGVDLMELQIPFSEPIADGPVILQASQAALAGGVRVDDCFRLARKITDAFDIPFLFMTYYNVVFKRGEEHFFAETREAGICGAIVPDIPPEEGESFMAALFSFLHPHPRPKGSATWRVLAAGSSTVLPVKG